jgi:BolA protein
MSHNAGHKNRIHRVRFLLQEAFDPINLEILDLSHLHAKHKPMKKFRLNLELGQEHGLETRGQTVQQLPSQELFHQDPPQETHFKITMTSKAFQGLSRIQQHRAVHNRLADEFKSGLHSLELHLKEG